MHKYTEPTVNRQFDTGSNGPDALADTPLLAMAEGAVAPIHEEDKQIISDLLKVGIAEGIAFAGDGQQARFSVSQAENDIILVISTPDGDTPGVYAIPITPDSVGTYGRASHNNVVIAHPQVSSVHARIFRDPQTAEIVVLSRSTNPSYIIRKQETLDLHSEEMPDVTKADLGGIAVAELHEPHTADEPEGQRKYLETIDRLEHGLSVLASSLESDKSTLGRINNSVTAQLERVNELLHITGMNLPERGFFSIRNDASWLIGQMQQFTDGLNALYRESNNPLFDRRSIQVHSELEEARSDFRRSGHEEQGRLPALITGVLNGVMLYNRSTHELGINQSSGNLIASSGQFLGRIHNLEALLMMQTSAVDVQDKLNAVKRDLEQYQSMLNTNINRLNEILNNIDLIRADLATLKSERGSNTAVEKAQKAQ